MKDYEYTLIAQKLNEALENREVFELHCNHVFQDAFITVLISGIVSIILLSVSILALTLGIRRKDEDCIGISAILFLISLIPIAPLVCNWADMMSPEVEAIKMIIRVGG